MTEYIAYNAHEKWTPKLDIYLPKNTSKIEEVMIQFGNVSTVDL